MIELPRVRAQEASAKLVGLDLSRSIAVALAMLAHTLTATGALAFVDGHARVLKVLLRTSTPMFIILFGVILEVVYLCRAEVDGSRKILLRMLERSLLCYVLYAVSAIPLVVTGRMSPGHFAATALMLGSTPYTDILRYYVVLFILAPAILRLRMRHGLLTVSLTAAAVHILHPILAALPGPSPKMAHGAPAKIIDLLVGVGSGTAGPSILHSLFFVAVGMLIGRLILDDRNDLTENLVSARKKMASLVGLLATGAVLSAFVEPETVNLYMVSGMGLRNANHPFYFFLGALLSSVFILLLRHAQTEAKGPLRLTMLGQRSSFTFSFGNAILYTVMGPYGLPIAAQLALSVLLLGSIFGCSAVYDILVPPSAILSQHFGKRFGSMTLHAVIDPVNTAIRAVASRLCAVGQTSRLRATSRRRLL